jgi:hypothetical protein
MSNYCSPQRKGNGKYLKEKRIPSLGYIFKHTCCKSLHRRKRNIGCLNLNHLHKLASAYSCTESNLIGWVKIPLQAVYQEGLNTWWAKDRQTDTGKQLPVWVFVFSAHQRPFLTFYDNKHRTLWDLARTLFILTAGFKEKFHVAPFKVTKRLLCWQATYNMAYDLSRVKQVLHWTLLPI